MGQELEVKKLIDDIGSTFEQFKKDNDERLKQIEEKGAADGLLTDKVERMNKALTETEGKLKEVETALARKQAAEPGETSKLEQKAADFAKLAAYKRGVQPEQFTGKDLQAYKEAFRDHMRKGDLMAPESAKALSVGSDPDGGYMVEPDTSGRMVNKIFETSPMRQVASVQSIGTDALEGNFDLDEASTGWVGETASRSETNTPQIEKWRIPVHELYAMPKATQKLLDDAMVDMEAWLADKVADKMARTENNAFVNGNGVGKPRGFLTYGAGTTLPGTIEQKNTGASGAFASAPNGGDVFHDMVYALKQGYRSGARFFMNRSTVAEVRKIKDSNGSYIWQPGLQQGTPALLAGYPVLEFEDMPDIAADSLSIAFGNMAEAYQIVDRQGVRVLRDPYSDKPYVLFYTVKRTGGDVVNFEAIKIMKFAS